MQKMSQEQIDFIVTFDEEERLIFKAVLEHYNIRPGSEVPREIAEFIITVVKQHRAEEAYERAMKIIGY